MTFDPRKFVACDGISAVFLDGFEKILHFDFHGAREHHLANDWEWLLIWGAHMTTKAVWLAVMT